MRFLADENIYPKIVTHLVNTGHDTVNVKELTSSGASDEEVFGLATKQKRVLITFDKHFANVLRYPPENTYGIIVIRIHPPVLIDIVRTIDRFLKEPNIGNLKGKLIVLTRKGYRISTR